MDERHNLVKAVIDDHGEVTMMAVGGYDTSLSGGATRVTHDLIFRALRATWPEGVWQEASSGEGVDFKEGEMPYFRPRVEEYFIHKNLASFNSWGLRGATIDNEDTMLSVTFDEDCISFVSEGPDSETHKLVMELIRAVQQHRISSLGMPGEVTSS